MKKNVILLLCLALGSHVKAQGVTNNGTLHISNSSDIFYAASDFTNASTAALTNNGSLYIKGNLSNAQASMAVGTGTLFLNGSASQAVNGTQPFFTFNLNTNNSTGITLNNNLSVSGTHTFAAGIITTSATPNCLLYEAGSAYTGAADSRHVNGWVKKNGSTAFEFPVGNGTYLRNIGVATLSTSALIEATYAGATTNTSNRESGIYHVNGAEHWILNKLSGGTAQVTMNWNHAKVPFPNYVLSDIRTVQYNAQWKNTGGTASGSVTGTGTITSSALSTFGPMTIGSVSNILPAKFLNVSIKRVAEINRITWLTTNEADLAGYEVERQTTGTSFTSIARVKAKNSLAEELYFYDDKDALTGKIFYRIKSVDNDGSVGYSKIVSVQVNVDSRIQVLENPVREKINLALTSIPKGDYAYTIQNATGQVVKQGQLSLEGTGNTFIPVSPSFTKGIYILKISSARTSSFIIKLIKD